MAGCLIAYGAVLGKVSPVQLLVMTLFGVTLFAVEEFIILSLIHVSLTCVCECVAVYVRVFLLCKTYFFCSNLLHLLFFKLQSPKTCRCNIE